MARLRPNRRLCFADLWPKRCRLPAPAAITLPVAEILNRLAADFFVFIGFQRGIVVLILPCIRQLSNFSFIAAGGAGLRPAPLTGDSSMCKLRPIRRGGISALPCPATSLITRCINS